MGEKKRCNSIFLIFISAPLSTRSLRVDLTELIILPQCHLHFVFSHPELFGHSYHLAHRQSRQTLEIVSKVMTVESFAAGTAGVGTMMSDAR